MMDGTTATPFEIATLALKLGDVIVLKLTGRFPTEDLIRTRDIMMKTFPDNKCIILMDGIELSVVTPEAKP